MNTIIRSFSLKYLKEFPLKLPADILNGGFSSSAAVFLVSSFFDRLWSKDKDKGKGAKKQEKERRSQSKGRSMVVVAASNLEAENMAAESLLYLDQEKVAFFPGFEGIPYEYARIPRDICIQRIKVLHRILEGENLLIFTSPAGVLRKLPEPARIREDAIRLKKGDIYEPRKFIADLVRLGYERVERVELNGEFCVKGSLIDIYPANIDQPIRVDFFDDEIDTLRLFDAANQVGLDKIKEATILPAGEIVLSPEESDLLIEALRERDKSDKLILPGWVGQFEEERKESKNQAGISLLNHAGLDEIFPLVITAVSFWDCFQTKPLQIVYPIESVPERVAVFEREYATLFEKENENRLCLPEGDLLSLDFLETLEEAEDAELNSDLILLREVGTGVAELAPIRSPEGFQGRVKEVRERILEILGAGGKVCVSSPYNAQVQRIAGIFRNTEGLKVKIQDPEKDPGPPKFTGKNTVWISKGALREGWRFPEADFYMWSDADIFGRSYKRRSRFKKAASTPLDSFIDLKEGDHVVHVNHGVGKFVKLERVTAAGRERDFLVLEYADNDKLFVPLDQISMIQRYISPSDKARLDSLGKSSFKKVKERVSKRVEELAEDLVELYAVRMSQKGYAFPDDTGWQEEFEADFQYEETPDQLTTIEAVKADMETPRPMDRLVCGDVGYGKTEVAIRAAFKAVMAGKQVAVIAPTTILALQHYRTFKERFKNYPINIDWISRFRTRKEVTEIKKNLVSGDIDVVVGTHALMSGDVNVKNLGLLVVDEEQRFGVSHKEALKNMKKLVDVLTLSATPIPRTLHMSLVGIRDLSLIQTAPQDRQPIRTHVMEDSDAVLQDAVRRELERGGQVFYLHNRVQSIEAAAHRLQELVPEAGFSILHGQMLEEEIEDILMDFLNKKYDVLVTTTIIESGIDMPNVNTLLVDRADTFGLSQLYQIRGRVGRSNRQAYAYLFYPSGYSLNEIARKRLETIQEYQELGSGFKVAMRDLEIRGAGNILGREQSGDIMDVGFELYVKLLDDAVKKLQGTYEGVEVRSSLNLNRDFFIPEDYIPDTRQRIEFYKRFEAAPRTDDVDRLEAEMTDRFGTPPEQARNFVLMEKVRTLASRAGFERVVEEGKGRVRFTAGDLFKVPLAHVVALVKKNPRLSILPGNNNALFYETDNQGLARMEELVVILEKLTVPLLEVEA